MSAKDGHLDALLASCAALEPDAVRILSYIAKRLEHGARKYGHIVLATDTRSFATEAMEESADLAVYATIGMLKIVDAEQAQEERRCELLNTHAQVKRLSCQTPADASPQRS